MKSINRLALVAGLSCIASTSLASPGHDAPICNIVGDSEAVLAYDPQTSNTSPYLKLDLEIGCDLDESKLNYIYNVKARMTTKQTI